MHVWNLWGSVSPTRLRTTGVNIHLAPLGQKAIPDVEVDMVRQFLHKQTQEPVKCEHGQPH